MERPSLSWKAYTGRVSFWLAIVFILLSGIFAPFGYLELRDGRLLAREGVDTQGSVVDRVTESRRRSSGGTSHSYYITVRFPGSDGRNHSARHSVSVAEYNRLSLGSVVPIRYAASDPGVTEMEAGDSAGTGRMLLGLAGLGALGGLASLVFLGRGVAAQRRAATEGERRMVPVTGHKRSGKKNSRYFQVEWNDGGQTRRTAAVREDRLPAIGSDIAVYLDPRSGRGWWEGEY